MARRKKRCAGFLFYSAPRRCDALTDPWGDRPGVEARSSWSWTSGDSTVVLHVGFWDVRSGFYPGEPPDIHDLSTRALRAALVGLLVMPLVYAALAITYGAAGAGPEFNFALSGIFWSVALHASLLVCLVRAVQTRDAPYCVDWCGCFACCGASRLKMFRCYTVLAQSAYVILGVVPVFSVHPEAIVLLLVALFACYLLHRTALIARRLQDLLPKNDVFEGGAVVLEEANLRPRRDRDNNNNNNPPTDEDAKLPDAIQSGRPSTPADENLSETTRAEDDDDDDGADRVVVSVESPPAQLQETPTADLPKAVVP